MSSFEHYWEHWVWLWIKVHRNTFFIFFIFRLWHFVYSLYTLATLCSVFPGHFVPKLNTPHLILYVLVFLLWYSGHHRAQYTATTAWVSTRGLHQETLTCSHFINLQTKILSQGRILMPKMFILKGYYQV